MTPNNLALTVVDFQTIVPVYLVDTLVVSQNVVRMNPGDSLEHIRYAVQKVPADISLDVHKVVQLYSTGKLGDAQTLGHIYPANIR